MKPRRDGEPRLFRPVKIETNVKGRGATFVNFWASNIRCNMAKGKAGSRAGSVSA
jgi:hypothetical protein